MVSVSFMAHRQDRHLSTQSASRKCVHTPARPVSLSSLDHRRQKIAGKTMPSAKATPRSRRNFLELAALSIGALGLGASAGAASGARRISIVTDTADQAAS